jgi:hypothetical protein
MVEMSVLKNGFREKNSPSPPIATPSCVDDAPALILSHTLYLRQQLI